MPKPQYLIMEDDDGKIHEINIAGELNHPKNAMCSFLINNGLCKKMDTCHKCHDITKQRLQPIKNIIYKLLFNCHKIWSYPVNQSMEKIYEGLLVHTKSCRKCENNKCIGGHNCHSGYSCNAAKICYQDLVFGNCQNQIYIVNFADSKMPDDMNISNRLYECCENGHHITRKQMPSYQQFIMKHHSEQYETRANEPVDNFSL